MREFMRGDETPRRFVNEEMEKTISRLLIKNYPRYYQEDTEFQIYIDITRRAMLMLIYSTIK